MNVGSAGCPVMVYRGVQGQPRGCDGEPTHTAVVRWRQRRRWVRVFLCDRHAREVADAEPMTDAHRGQLAERREEVRRALAGLRYRPVPTSTDREAL